ncbi:MAG TPA: 50S ribosomal protein L13 [bacterium]|nr:50S ribosomal protein L13 [bacterium]HPT29954.1 50S ribosomal protein L13 [bacterium]
MADKKAQPIKRAIHHLDAEGQAAGRLATQIAILLRGKNKASYLPHIDAGDIVEVKNVKLMKFTGKKLEQKEYKSYSGYLGGLKRKKLSVVMKTKPAEVLQRAVKQMLPPTKLRPAMMKRLIIK